MRCGCFWSFRHLKILSLDQRLSRSKIQDPDQKIKTETEKKKQKIEISGRAEISEMHRVETRNTRRKKQLS